MEVDNSANEETYNSARQEGWGVRLGDLRLMAYICFTLPGDFRLLTRHWSLVTPHNTTEEEIFYIAERSEQLESRDRTERETCLHRFKYEGEMRSRGGRRKGDRANGKRQTHAERRQTKVTYERDAARYLTPVFPGPARYLTPAFPCPARYVQCTHRPAPATPSQIMVRPSCFEDASGEVREGVTWSGWGGHGRAGRPARDNGRLAGAAGTSRTGTVDIA